VLKSNKIHGNSIHQIVLGGFFFPGGSPFSLFLSGIK
jgi:hypothetical protein